MKNMFSYLLSSVSKIIVLIVLICTCKQSNIHGKFVDDDTPLKMIMKENYPSEVHTVITDDEYMLTIYRIPGPLGSIPVFLQHGLFESSADWLHSGRSKSLAYFLSDHGYDVWLGNARGSTYSKRHIRLSIQNPEYWNFSWHELGVYDIPACVTYVSRITNNTLYYIGHSMGASSFTVMASEKPHIAKNIRAMFGLAPAVYEYHIKQPILKFLSKFSKELQFTANNLGIHELLPRNHYFNTLAYHFCKIPDIANHICSNLLFAIGGYNSEQLNYTLLPSIWSNAPSGTSVKLFCHWLQQINVNEFRNFDYGDEKNMLVYKSIKPHAYNFSKIQVPIAVFSSDNDLIVSTEDVQHFYNQVPRKLGIYEVNNNFSHFDFLLAKDASYLLYSRILKIMFNFNN